MFGLEMKASCAVRFATAALMAALFSAEHSRAQGLEVTFFGSTSNTSVQQNGFPSGVVDGYSARGVGAMTYSASDNSYSFQQSARASGFISSVSPNTSSSSTADFITQVYAKPGVFKGKSATGASVFISRGFPSYTNRASASTFTSLNTRDNLNFNFSDTSISSGKIKVTSVAQVSSGFSCGGRSSCSGAGSDWSLSSQFDLFRSSSNSSSNGNLLSINRWSAGGSTGAPSTLANYCRNLNLEYCLNNGEVFESFILDVQPGNSLRITNALRLNSQTNLIGLQILNTPPPLLGMNSFVDFGTSGYTLIEILTPGVSYIADSGATYLTAVPSMSAVPEPASWGMMIIGFGLAGASIRRNSLKAIKI